MTRLLLLSYTFPPENTPAAVRPGQLFEYLPRFGYEPVVVACSYPGAPPDDESVRRVPRQRVSAPIRLASNAARIFERYAVPHNDRFPWVPHAIAEAETLIRTKAVDAIFSTSPFMAGHLAALWLARKHHLPWIADFQDPVSDNPARLRRWFYPYDLLLERTLFSSAHHLLANTDTVAATWTGRYPQWKEKVSIFWNSFDPAEKMPIPIASSRPYRLLTHVGNLYSTRRPQQLVAALNRLLDDGRLDPSALRVKLVGNVAVWPDEKPLMDRLSEAGVLDYNDIRVPREDALQAVADADYLLLIDMPTTIFQLPSKLLDYIRIGRPVLAFTLPDSPVERILARSGIPHVTIPPGAPESVTCQKILEFLQLPPTRRAADPWFDETFNCINQAGMLAKLLDQARRARK